MKLGSDKKTNDKERELPPAGTHLAYLYRVVDAGWCIYSFQGAPAHKDDGSRRVRLEGRLDFELWPTDEKTGEFVLMSTGMPFSVSPGFNGWLTGAKMKGVLKTWRGDEDPEVEGMLGQPAFITVAHNPWKSGDKSGVNVEVTAVAPVPQMMLKAMKLPEMKNPVCVYSSRDHDEETFLKLPEWYQKKIKQDSASYARAKGLPNPGESAHHSEDPGPETPVGADQDIPF